MSDRPSDQLPANPREFVPSLNPLESRLLLSQQVFFPDSSSFVFPLFARLPRTGGATLQSGTALTVGVGQPTTNTALVQEKGAGNLSVEWNGRPTRSFTNVQATLVQIGRARRDEVTFHLTNPRTSGTAFATGQIVATPTVSAQNVAHPVHPLRLTGRRTGGTAIQTGSVLTVTVTTPKINSIAIESWNQGALVQAEWNGGAVHAFAGVDTIIVDIRNGRKDLVALDEAAAKGP